MKPVLLGYLIVKFLSHSPGGWHTKMKLLADLVCGGGAAFA
jgi:hypothetical protein